jgi:hypothetical protein
MEFICVLKLGNCYFDASLVLENCGANLLFRMILNNTLVKVNVVEIKKDFSAKKGPP